MRPTRLSENSKKVLCGLCSYPTSTDKSLARDIGVNTSTISTIRQRMKEQGLIKVKIVPNYFTIEHGTVIVASGNFRYHFPDDIRNNVSALALQPSTPFYKALDNMSWVSIGALYSPTAKDDPLKIRELPSILGDQYIRDTTFNISKNIFYPAKVKVWRYFDYAHLFCHMFKVGSIVHTSRPSKRWSPSTFKSNAKNVLQSIIKEPDSSDYRRSQVLDLSHPTFSKIKKRMMKRGVVKTIIEPDLAAFGFSVLAWFRITLDNRELDRELIAQICGYPNNILSVYDDEKIFMLSVFENIAEVMHEQEKITSTLSEVMIPYENIESNYFSIEKSNFHHALDALPALQMVLGRVTDEEAALLPLEPATELRTILTYALDDAEVERVMQELCSNLDEGTLAGDPPKVLASMILELLTEPQYLSSLDSNEKVAIQTELIQKLNTVRRASAGDGQIRMRALGQKRKTLMIVEDSRETVELLRKMLEEAGFMIVGIADNGQDAVEMYKTLSETDSPPQIVLLDIFIKGLNGIKATEMIKHYDPAACIAVLTSSLNSKTKAKMTDLGVDDYLIKPLTRMQLVTSLERILRSRRSRAVGPSGLSTE